MKSTNLWECNTLIYNEGGGSTVELTDLTLSYDKKDDYYYLSAGYRYEDNGVIKYIYIPKALLPIDKHRVTIEHSIDRAFPVCDIGFGELNLLRNSDGQYMLERVIEEKIHEMTLDEIEKKLGYKVKIVNSK